MLTKHKTLGLLLLSFLTLFLWVAADESGDTPKNNILDPRVKPGNRFKIEFDEFPTTLANLKSSLTIYIPTDYTSEKKFPLFLWLSQAKGHQRDRSPLVEGKGCVVITFPLYRKTGPVAEDVSAETVSRICLSEDDAELIWPIYKKMLAKVESIVPNIDPDNRLAGGFSNGAHCISILLNRTNQEFQDYFNSYFLVEGGLPYVLREKKKYPGKRYMLLMYGEMSQKRSMPGLAQQSVKCGIDVEEIEMPGVGHDFPDKYMPRVTDWIYRKVLFGYFPDKLAPIKKLVKRRKYTDALNQLNEMKTEVAGYEIPLKMIDEVWSPLEEKAAKELKMKLRKKVPPAGIEKYKKLLDKFIKRWPKTKAAAKAQEAIDLLE